MSKPVHDLHLDFETYCDLDLKKVGVCRYVEHPSFRILCVAWRLDARAVVKAHGHLPQDLKDLLANRNVQGHAFNAAFETAVLRQLGVPVANPISCTMQRARAYGLPGSLAAACFALSLTNQKDTVGHKLMLKMSKPLRPGAKPWTVTDYERLADYCAKDVEAESDLADVIPPLPPDEWELSQLDAAMNTSGELGIDQHRVATFGMIAATAEKEEAARCTLLTGGAVTSPGTQTARLKAWLETQGVPLSDTQRATIEEALADPLALPAVVLEVLQIRMRTARASNKKLASMMVHSDSNGALHGQFQFCGAGRTGRWSGKGVQVQNLPRLPKGFDAQLFYDMAAADVDNIGMVASAPLLDCVSWSLRSCLKATDDNMIMWSFDFSQIEARVLAWLAGQHDVLAVFASGHDVYVWAAAQFGSNDRNLGKVLVLALGFGMGAAKLKDTAWKAYGVKLTLQQAEAFKTLWRQRNRHIVAFWAEMEAAARGAILRRGSVHPVGGSGVAFTCTPRTLQMRLPSGRVLYYHRARVDMNTGSIVYWGKEEGKSTWGDQRTYGGKLAENAAQAAARDIMSEAMLRAHRRDGRVPIMTVHDELIYPLDKAACGWSKLKALLLEAPQWAGGLPLAGEDKMMRRYGIALQLVAIGGAAKP